jgi:threonine/homoserine/homoserine lactone efflux protein
MHSDLVVILTTLTLYFVVVVSPGPNFAFVSRLAISGSRKAAFGASVGFASASLLYALLTMTGLAVLLREVGWVAHGVQILGGCYLIYLGVSAWLSKARASATVTSSIARSGWYGLRTGSIVGLSNPKGIAFFIGLYAAVIPPDTSIWAKAAIIVGGFSIETLWYGLVGTLLSMTAPRAFYKRSAKWIERTLGALMVGFGLRLIWDQSE